LTNRCRDSDAKGDSPGECLDLLDRAHLGVELIPQDGDADPQAEAHQQAERQVERRARTDWGLGDGGALSDRHLHRRDRGSWRGFQIAAQPITEDSLLTGALEPTNDAYAIAKISGILQVQAVRRQDGLPWISAMPTNLYGPGDNFDLAGSHVMPAMIRKFHEAKGAGDAVTLWGSGTPRREFLHVDDLAAACLHLLSHYDDPQHINVGTGEDVTIRELAETIQATVCHQGDIDWDTGKPDGTPRKLLDVSRIKALGWEPKIALSDGIASTYEWYLANSSVIRG
jgi:GDP-L-fucose synthase